MAFKRKVDPARASAPEPSALAADLAAIGFRLGVAPAKAEPNIEDTLLFASREALEKDLRLVAFLILWIRIHRTYVNVDRLTRLVKDDPSTTVRAFWAGIARWLHVDRRFARMAKVHRGPRVDLGGAGAEDPRFRRGPIRVPASVTRERDADVLPPASLALRHRAYRWRIVIGPSYRADMWAALEAEPALTCTELARRAYGSYATAWLVKRDQGILDTARVRRKTRPHAG